MTFFQNYIFQLIQVWCIAIVEFKTYDNLGATCYASTALAQIPVLSDFDKHSQSKMASDEPVGAKEAIAIPQNQQATSVASNSVFSMQSNENYDEIVIKDSEIKDAELYAASFKSARFINCKIINVQLDNAVLDGADFVDCELENVNFRLSKFGCKSSFRNSTLKNIRFDNTTAHRIVFSNTAVHNSKFVNCSMAYAQFSHCYIIGSDFRSSSLKYADFSESTLLDANFSDAVLTGISLRNATIDANVKFNRSILDSAFLGDFDLTALNISYIKWQRDMLLGEELEADILNSGHGSGKAAATKLYAQAETIYRNLATKFGDAGKVSECNAFRYRALETRRKFLQNSQDSRTTEYVWLCLTKHLDRYGTDPLRLFYSFLLMVSVFGVIYFAIWITSDPDNAKWYVIDSFDGNVVKAQDGSPLVSCTPAPKKVFEDAKGRKTVLIVTKLYVYAVWFSFECSFLFAEKVFSVPDFISFLRPKNEKLVTKGLCKVFVGIEALLGLFYFVLTTRMAINYISL